MKILFYRYGSICENDILDCFKESGHEVVEITKEIYRKDISFKESVEIVNKALQDNPCDCVFTINFFPALSDLCNILHIRYICWTVDSPVLELFAASISNEWNRIFVFDRAQYEDIVAYNPNCIFHYPLAVDVKKKQQAIKDASISKVNEKYRTDVSFVGSFYSEKSPYDSISNPSQYLKGYLEGIMQSQMKVYGYFFIDSLIDGKIADDFKKAIPKYYKYEMDNYLTDSVIISQYYLGNKITSMERFELISGIARHNDIDVYTGSDISSIATAKIHNRGRCLTDTQMPVIFNESRININPTSKAIRSGVPLRAFDIMACEGFMLSNYQTEMCELFTPGEHFVYYDSIEAVPDLIAYYLEHDGLRREIAHNAYEKVSKEYNYMLRLNGLLLKAFEV